ncbi:polysaccharide deacetylase family sporulation protein PdaB [Oceanobacillus sp. FSL H7-0719]|uniref:polysaccharide deacetylase family sporulation protein PdaB n=1 Tax=Oceanobacillus sp. FSL H7-0719 TaxID=2954507 RepID=UPI00324EB1DB
MDHFYVVDFNRKRRFILLGIIGVFIAGFIFMQANNGLLWANDSDEVALTKGDAEEPNVALTFNISWGEERVHDILKKLKQEEVQATFFLSGEWAERHPTIVEKIAEDKHEIGMLGYRYKSYLDQEIEQVQKDLFLAQEVFSKLGYEDTKLLRTPSGHFNEEVLELAKSMGFEVVHWNINPNDWENPGTENIVDTVMKNTTNGDILLMHASDSAKQTAGALETILPGLKNKGFTFVPISELISQAHAEVEIVE